METATLHCHAEHCHSHPDGLSPFAWFLAFSVVAAIIALRAPHWVRAFRRDYIKTTDSMGMPLD
jgi:hypothetical protein